MGRPTQLLHHGHGHGDSVHGHKCTRRTNYHGATSTRPATSTPKTTSSSKSAFPFPVRMETRRSRHAATSSTRTPTVTSTLADYAVFQMGIGHAPIPLRGLSGNILTIASTEPYSDRETCTSTCHAHDVDRIANGFIHQQGRTDVDGNIIMRDNFYDDGRWWIRGSGMVRSMVSRQRWVEPSDRGQDQRARLQQST